MIITETVEYKVEYTKEDCKAFLKMLEVVSELRFRGLNPLSQMSLATFENALDELFRLDRGAEEG